ncbi:flagellar hook-length control protein FliK [Desemzia sp. FAM 23991]|uniref:flagellar hook-length control protein FliK n=1 Tax=unclassified Desemzia TaxID=2685243 RepID=UPI00388859CC
MQAIQAATTIHNTTEPATGQQTTAVEKAAFSEQLEQSIDQQAKKAEDSVKDDSSSDQSLETDEAEQNAEQMELSEDEVKPDAAFLCYQPFLTAEQQLAVRFKHVSVEKEIEQNDGQTTVEPLQPQNTAMLNRLEVGLKATEAVLPGEKNAVLPISLDGTQDTVETEVKKMLPDTLQIVDKTAGPHLTDQTVSLITDKMLDAGKPVEQAVVTEDGQEASAMQEKPAVGQQNLSVSSNQQSIVDPLVAEEAAELKQPPVVEGMQMEISDLDVQSDLRLKVTAATTSDSSFAQQPVTQREVQLPVALNSGSLSTNQQVLSQAISEVVMDQVTTLKDGQQTMARLSLTPETLGHIKIELRMRDSQLQTTIVVETTETKELLDSSMQQLTTSLAQKNIQLQDVSIQLNLPQNSSFTFAESGSQQNAQQQDSEQSAMYFDPVEEIGHPKTNEEEDSTTGRLSILA